MPGGPADAGSAGAQLFKAALTLGPGGAAGVAAHPALAAALGGYLVFGDDGPVSMQVNLYLLSRVLAALARLAGRAWWGAADAPPARAVAPWLAAAVWGAVLWLYEHHAPLLQPSLAASMRYLYTDSTRWAGARDFLLGGLP